MCEIGYLVQKGTVSCFDRLTGVLAHRQGEGYSSNSAELLVSMNWLTEEFVLLGTVGR